MKLLICQDYQDLSEKAAALVSDLLKRKPNLVFCLPAGGTPIGMYGKLVELYQQGKIDFSEMITFNMDEYVGLQPSHKNSFVYFLKHHFLNHININAVNVNFPNIAAVSLQQECQRYQALIDEKGGLDLAITGIGDNGHIAFNEPAAFLKAEMHLVELDEKTIKANSRFFEDDSNLVPKKAISLGMRSIMQSRTFMVMASGKHKAEALARFFKDDYIDPHFPLSFVKMHPNAIFLIDEDAASLLPK